MQDGDHDHRDEPRHDDRDETRRQRAYDLWEREGRPEGRADEHWRSAQRGDEVAADAVAGPTSGPQTPPGGPHAKPELTNASATPGAGALPDPEDPANSADSTSG
jgi:hypothetical protein